jgi:hypothetical protein
LLSNEIVKNECDKNVKMKDWWNSNISFDGNVENKLTSTEIWNRFKKDNKEYVDENKLLVEDVKNYIQIFIDVDNYLEKSKKGAIELIGFKFNDLLVQTNETMDVELNIPTTIQKKKPVVKGK